MPGIHFIREQERYYPEGNLAAQVAGFVGKDSEGKDIGRYGVEGYWQEDLAGSNGFLKESEVPRGIPSLLREKYLNKHPMEWI